MSTRLPLWRLATMCPALLWGLRMESFLTTWWVRSTRLGLLLPANPVPGLHDRPAHGRDCSDWVCKDFWVPPPSHHSLQQPALPGVRRWTHYASAGSYQVCQAGLELVELMFLYVWLLIRMKPKSILILILSFEPEIFIFYYFWQCLIPGSWPAPSRSRRMLTCMEKPAVWRAPKARAHN